jgi:putative NADH-flavin reductase
MLRKPDVFVRIPSNPFDCLNFQMSTYPQIGVDAVDNEGPSQIREESKPMRIAIFGASGRTGNLLTKNALAAGYEVTALLRRPAEFPFRDQVRVVSGDAFDAVAIAETLSGADAVLSALGARSLGKEDVLERAVPLIVAAMERNGPRRIVTLGSAGALPTGLDKQNPLRRWIIEHIVYTTLLKWPVASQRAQWAALSASRLDWTMVMPPMLTNSHARGHIRIDGGALPQNGSKISRADVANFMLRQLSNPEWLRRGVYLSD